MPRALGSVDSISDELIRKSHQNIISLFWPKETLCEVLLCYDNSKCHFFQFLVFLSLSTRISVLPTTASRLCTKPRDGWGLFLTSKLKALKGFWKRLVIMPFPHFFEREKIPLLSQTWLISNLILWTCQNRILIRFCISMKSFQSMWFSMKSKDEKPSYFTCSKSWPNCKKHRIHEKDQ